MSQVKSATVTLGDLLQRVAVGIHRELEENRSSLRRMDPELRTKLLRAFVSRTLKKLLQLYAICQWLNGPSVRQFFSNLNELKRQVSMLEAQLSETQDQLYWKHAQLFPMRSRALEVAPAMDLLSSGNYPHLPSVIFSCGRFPVPGKKLDPAALVQDMEVYIRAKLALFDPLPRGVTSATISNGVLKISQADVYEVYVTLTQLSEDACWLVLDSSILARSRATEIFEAGYDVDTLNWELGTILVDRCKAVIPVFAPDTLMGPDGTTPIIEEANIDESKIVNDSGISTMLNNENNGSAGKKDVVSAQFTLSHIHAICRYVGISALHRLLYAQAFESLRGVWKTHLDVIFYEDVDSFQLRTALWRSAHTGAFQAELRVVQDREPIKFLLSGGDGTHATSPSARNTSTTSLDQLGVSATGSVTTPLDDADAVAGLRLELYLLSSEKSRDQAVLIRHLVSDASDALDLTSLAVRGGAAFTPLLEQTIFVLATSKLKYLLARITCTGCIGPSAPVAALRSLQVLMGPSSLRIVTASNGSNPSTTLLTVHVDARSGDFVLQAFKASNNSNNSDISSKLTLLPTPPGGAKPKIQALLVKEMNSVEIQQDLLALLGTPPSPLGASSQPTQISPGLGVFSNPESFLALTSGSPVGLPCKIRPLVNLQSFLLELTFA